MVSPDSRPIALACWKDTVAVSLDYCSIIILDAITGIPTSVLSGNIFQATSLAFSLDGVFLVSGNYGETVELWDIQTGGVIKTFHGHTGFIWSVSISPDCAMVASGSADNTIRLWDVQTGGGHCVIYSHKNIVTSVSFSPTNPQLLISASYDNTIRQWDINGHQIGPTHDGYCIAHSLDGTHFVSWVGKNATVWDSNSGVAVTELQVPSGIFKCCCFSPDGKFLAGCSSATIYVWNVTSSHPYLIETFVGHTKDIVSLTFSSSLISSSYDGSVRFWQIGDSSENLAAAESESIPLTSASIESITLQVNGGVAISSDSVGVVRVWDLLTGLCRASSQASGIDSSRTDVWESGVPGSIPVPISSIPPQGKPKPHLDFIHDLRVQNPSPPRIQDAVTGKEVFWLHGRYARPTCTQWDGQYLVAGYDSGEVLILDFNHVIP